MNRRSRLLCGVALILSALAGCTTASDGETEPSDSDEDAIAQGFDRDVVLSDEELTNTAALDEQRIEAFLAKTPYGTRAPIADLVVHGVPIAKAIHDRSVKYGLSPLVFLTRAQLEGSLLTKKPANPDVLDFAFGCGCYDGEACKEEYRGFDLQMDCLGKTMRQHLDKLAQGKATASGWKVGVTKTTLDPLPVTPKTRATAALYTYAPWVGSAGGGKARIGGNSLHYVIWKKLAVVALKDGGAPADASASANEAGIPVDNPPADAGASGWHYRSNYLPAQSDLTPLAW